MSGQGIKTVRTAPRGNQVAGVPAGLYALLKYLASAPSGRVQKIGWSVRRGLKGLRAVSVLQAEPGVYALKGGVRLERVGARKFRRGRIKWVDGKMIDPKRFKYLEGKR